MAQIDKPNLHFNTKLYTGNGSTNAITGVGFQPDWVWIKSRGAADNHNLFDVLRGANKYIYSNDAQAEVTDTNRLNSFDSDGFTLGDDEDVNENGDSLVAWNWKANGAGSSNSDGDITSTVSANTTAGFSVVTWTANGSTNDGVGHGLGAEPKIIIYKRYDATNDWYVVYKFVDDSLDFIKLNTTDAKQDLNIGTYGFASSTTFTNLGFANSQQVVAYAFAEKRGYSKFGSYVGNGNASGSFVYTGFKPAFTLIKRDATDNWAMHDNRRPERGGNPNDAALRANLADGEYGGSQGVDFLSNGFKARQNDGEFNASGNSYIYLAIAEEPLVANVGNGIPATAV